MCERLLSARHVRLGHAHVSMRNGLEWQRLLVRYRLTYHRIVEIKHTKTTTAECVGCTNGVCVTSVSPPQCVCTPGWYGANCTDASIVTAKKTSGKKKGHSVSTAAIFSGAAIGVAVVVGLAVYLLRYRFRTLMQAGSTDTEYMLQ